MEGRRVPTRVMTQGAVVPRLPGSTRPTPVVPTSQGVSERVPVITSPSSPREGMEPVTVSVGQRETVNPVTVEAPKYREANPILTTSNQTIQNYPQSPVPVSLSELRKEYAKIPPRIPDGILLERHTRR